MISYKNIFFSHLILFLGFIIAGCSSTPRFAEKTRTEPPRSSSSSKQAIPESAFASEKGEGKVLLTLTGVASYYAEDFNGKKTSNGEVYDMNSHTAAHRTFPFGTKVRVVNLDNNKSVIVRINDRGPFHEGRILDLSYGAAKEIDLIRLGTAHIRLEVIEWGKGK
jgi:rare lipoprotein A